MRELQTFGLEVFGGLDVGDAGKEGLDVFVDLLEERSQVRRDFRQLCLFRSAFHSSE